MNIDEIKLDVSSSAIDEIVDQLNINGIVCLDNAISPAILDRFRGEVQKELNNGCHTLATPHTTHSILSTKPPQPT